MGKTPRNIRISQINILMQAIVIGSMQAGTASTRWTPPYRKTDFVFYLGQLGCTLMLLCLSIESITTYTHEARTQLSH